MKLKSKFAQNDKKPTDPSTVALRRMTMEVGSSELYNTSPSPSCYMKLPQDERQMAVRLQIVVVGGPAVGKTSLVRQFVSNEFADQYSATRRRQFYYPAVILNDQVYEICIADCPPMYYFPLPTDYRPHDRSTAYILVYDASREDSFQYIRILREHILESRTDMGHALSADAVPLVVAAAKWDLVGNGNACGDEKQNGQRRREIAQLVKKSWKVPHIECSAKSNWHMVLLFKEVVKMIYHLEHKVTTLGLHDAFRTRKCAIL